MDLSKITAISPVDGRYRDKAEELAPFFSEFGLIKYRLLVEIEYFIELSKVLPQLSKMDSSKMPALKNIYTSFTPEQAARIKEIESITNHDVKSVEYFIKEEFDKLGMEAFKEFVHFGLTSQDINNTAVPLSLKDSSEAVLSPLMKKVRDTLVSLADEWKNIPMLARTHGQPASPTRLGKEVMVFVERIDEQLKLLMNIPFSAKFGGATGNFNAHHAAYPGINWTDFGNNFVNKTLGLYRSKITTQIEHYDNLAAYFDNLKRFNTILIDLCRDFWTYISMEYFKQKIKKDEVGSSAMPHKVNPIDFENAEGNFGYANAIFEHLSAKLPISRLQRDLTDSTVLRNIGVPLAHTLIGLKSLLRGLGKVIVNADAIHADLEKNWIVVSEALQTILRREGYPQPYEALKGLTRTGKAIGQQEMNDFIDSLNVSPEVKSELKLITPFNYTGI